MPTKIETHLTPEEFLEFCKRCAQTKGGTKLATIKAIAEEFGVTISLMAATSFRDGPMADYIEELKRKSELAETVAAIGKAGAGLSDAAAKVLEEKVFDASLRLDVDEVGGKKANNISLAVARLQTGDRNAKRLVKELEHRDEQIDKLKRERTEWDEKRAAAKAALSEVKKVGGLSKETLAKIEEAAGLL